jgi:hypothetical protein
VQALPSSQGAALFSLTHPVCASQESVVHPFPSSQSGGGPPTHRPPAHASDVVQALPSLQGAMLSSCEHPRPGSHPSFVHTLPSSQSGAGPPTHSPPAHVSNVVHAFPSSHGTTLSRCAHPLIGSQESSVHTFPSSQSGAGPPAQAPPAHVSDVEHAFPSLHGSVLCAWVHPMAGSHESVVHTFPSSQSGPGPPMHRPPEQVSEVVQADPSSHGLALGACAHPVAGSHESSVHTFPSSQFGAGPPAQAPPEHVSDVVQALPSSQGAALGVFAHPETP